MAFALISLFQTLEQLLHPQHNVLSIHKLVKTFQNKLCVLREFLQNCCTGHGKSWKYLEIKIINVARKADDIISSSILDIGNQVEGRRFPDELRKLIAEVDSIVKEVRRFDKKWKPAAAGRIQGGTQNYSPYSSSYPTTVVGLEDDFRIIKDRLGNSRDLQVVTIVGMGGIGKTTLAKTVYLDPWTAQHFDRCAWITVSQDYQERQVYLGILGCFVSQMDKLEEKRTDQLQELVYKSLKGRRYVVVLDDIWNTTIWDDLRRLFPNDGTDSRIILTTRLVEVALYASSGKPPHHHMHFLSIDDGWKLLSGKVVGKDPKLEKIGKQIVGKCRGLPLAILVVAGLLSKVNRAIDDWENVLKNVNALVSSSTEDCFGILGLSYHHLPLHLKTCFLYTALFPEDALIPVSKVIKLWIAEGFVEAAAGTSSSEEEEVAETWLEELIDRSLVLICKRGSNGKPKTCMVHDLLREFCLREANTQKFLLVVINNNNDTLHPHMNCHIRFGFQSIKWKELEKVLQDSAPNMSRSILSFGMSSCILHRYVKPNFGRFKLLRVLDVSSVRFNCYGLMDQLKHLIYLRYLAVTSGEPKLHFDIAEFQCLQTFIIHNVCPTPTKVFGPIYKVPQLRHLKLGSGSRLSCYDDRIQGLLPNLQTFSGLCPSSCGRGLFRHFPNLKKLGISYFDDSRGRPDCLQSVHLLPNLVALKFEYMGYIPYDIAVSQKLNLSDAFPLNLKKLTLLKTCLPWKDITVLVRLPRLEVLKLKKQAFTGPEWETTSSDEEESFQQLKVLVLESLDLVCWEVTRSDCFPRLQHLSVRHCYRLKGIPCEMGDILTLQEIELEGSNRSVMDSAQEILEEQQNWGNDEFRLRFASNLRTCK